MKIITSAAVAAPREQVYAALNDRNVLRRTIPGCLELTDVDADTFVVKLSLGVAGIKGKLRRHGDQATAGAARITHACLRRQGQDGLRAWFRRGQDHRGERGKPCGL